MEYLDFNYPTSRPFRPEPSRNRRTYFPMLCCNGWTLVWPHDLAIPIFKTAQHFTMSKLFHDVECCTTSSYSGIFKYPRCCSGALDVVCSEIQNATTQSFYESSKYIHTLKPLIKPSELWLNFKEKACLIREDILWFTVRRSTDRPAEGLWLGERGHCRYDEHGGRDKPPECEHPSSSGKAALRCAIGIKAECVTFD